MKTNIQSAARYKGFTVVEVMVAMTLGLLMLVGVVSLLVGSKRSFSEQTEMSRLQENARFAIEVLMKDIRMAGYVGCVNDINQVRNNLTLPSTDVLGDLRSYGNLQTTPSQSAIAIEGIDNKAGTSSAWSVSGSTAQVSNIINNTDAIIVRHFSPPLPIQLSRDMTSSTEAIPVSDTAGLRRNMVLAISSCAGADIFQVTSVRTASPNRNIGHTTTTGNASGQFSKLYATDAQLHRYQANRYYIRNNSVRIPSLYRTLITNAGGEVTQELITGVEDMQILYGDGSSFTNAADSALNWGEVNSVKIALLMRTVDEYGTDTDTETYNLLGRTVDPPDLRVRRKVFNATIEIRNRN